VRTLAILLALLVLLPDGLPAQEDPAEPIPADGQPAEPPVEEGLPTENASPPEKPRSRLRPVTEAEEERYKRQAVLEDPFLNSPLGPDPRNLAYYRPVDFLRTEVFFDSSRYLVQDEACKLQGFLTFEVAPFATSKESLLRLSLDCAAPRRRVELYFEEHHLKPRRVLIFAPASLPDPAASVPKAAKTGENSLPKAKHQAKSRETLPEGDLQGDLVLHGDGQAERRTEIEYLFDRVTIERDAGLVATQERMRQLPYSFDIEQLPLLVRQLDFEKLERQWPFEALITAPERKRSLQLRIDQPKKVEVLTAEPQARQAYELKMRLGETDSWTWWVERAAPYRLVKFTDGQYTYTLNQYEAGQGHY
jgi:hypothetical protein